MQTQLIIHNKANQNQTKNPTISSQLSLDAITCIIPICVNIVFHYSFDISVIAGIENKHYLRDQQFEISKKR